MKGGWRVGVGIGMEKVIWIIGVGEEEEWWSGWWGCRWYGGYFRGGVCEEV